MRGNLIRIITAVVLGTTLIPVGQRAQGPAQQGQGRTTEQQFKNIKVLTGLPANQLNITMHNISGQLGVDCVFCHIWDKWDVDVKPNKQIARQMLTMVQEMNKTYFGGAPMITCYTCHRGSPMPVSTRIVPDTISLRPMTAEAPPLPTEEIVKEEPSYPSAQEILAKYIKALGGEDALRKVTSRVITAKRDYPFGPAGLEPVMADVEIYQKAPNLTVMISKTDKFTVSEGFDGQMAWVQGMNGNVNDLPQPDQQRAKRAADFYESLDMPMNYSRLEVTGVSKVNGHDTYLVIGYPQSDSPERLYFDVKTGLLVRRLTTLPTLLGLFPYAIDYDDYRKTKGGVMLPFIVRMNPSTPRDEAKTNSTLQVLRVRDNVPIEDNRFIRPLPQSGTAK
jgi:photosynthetic reaction center cytochrome c subunit